MFIGKIVGAIIGLKFGGFFGMIAGIFVGHLADKKIYELGSVRSSIFRRKLTRQSLFMQTTFAVLGHLSKAKGRVTDEDIALANNLMAQMNLDQAGIKLAQDAFTRGKDANFPLRQAIQEFREGCGQRNDLLRMFLTVQVKAAFADDVLDPREQEILYIIAEELGVSRFQFDQMIAMELAARQFRGFYQQAGAGGFYQQQDTDGFHDYSQQQQYHQYQRNSGPTLADAYQVLGVSESDDQQTVKRAYRRLMSENHPDKLISKGLPKEMLEMAKEKTQQIQAAYDLIRKAKGWR
ncbi:molecular chaperone DjlA [Actinobacillus delphinicola]|uniref:co-chaperone DjlA n=1 Tax=Actinobacillus delphinicola TaxID=51161 RepID=UPI0024421978|nr:co-chaperone DjlA [Actinobacillus delphinicola]MDG6897414.1 molecular chaperone DjlA [Actinobacillus delphinicola]